MIDSPIKRRLSRQIRVGSVPIGGNAPIAVQSMTNTNTCNASATVEQIEAIVDAGYSSFEELNLAKIIACGIEPKKARLVQAYVARRNR